MRSAEENKNEKQATPHDVQNPETETPRGIIGGAFEHPFEKGR
jgi:hypothetical protein